MNLLKKSGSDSFRYIQSMRVPISPTDLESYNILQHITKERLQDLVLEITAFVTDHKPRVYISNHQILELVQLAIHCGVRERPFAAHLMMMNEMDRLFRHLRDLIETQEQNKPMVDITTTSIAWLKDRQEKDEAGLLDEHGNEIAHTTGQTVKRGVLN